MKTTIKFSHAFVMLMAVAPLSLSASRIDTRMRAVVTDQTGAWTSPLDIESIVNRGYGSWEMTNSSTTAVSSSTAYAQVAAEVGSLKTQVYGSANGDGAHTVASIAHAAVDCQDTIHVAASSTLNGTLALLKLSLFVPGTTAFSGFTYDGFAEFQLSASLSSGGDKPPGFTPIKKPPRGPSTRTTFPPIALSPSADG